MGTVRLTAVAGIVNFPMPATAFTFVLPQLNLRRLVGYRNIVANVGVVRNNAVLSDALFLKAGQDAPFKALLDLGADKVR